MLRLELICISLFCISCGVGKDLKQERTTYIDVITGDGEARGPNSEDLTNGNTPGQTDDNSNNPDDETEVIPDDEFDQTLKLRGEIQDVSAVGEVYGWAVFPDDTAISLSVDVYVNGNATTGTLIGTYDANQEGFDNGFDGNHAFRAQIPDEFRNGATHTLTAFAEIDGNVEPVFTKEFSFRSFLPTEEGRAYYNNTLRPLLQNACGGCHANRAPVVTYDAQYDYMLSPNPAKTGTASNNTLINKASGGMNHGGNNRCGANGKNGNPCAQIQTWWNMEFGTE